MRVITRRQRQVLEFIKGFIHEEGYAPTHKEIASALGVRSSATVHGYLVRLEANGWIRIRPYTPSGIQVINS